MATNFWNFTGVYPELGLRSHRQKPLPVVWEKRKLLVANSGTARAVFSINISVASQD